ncbi:MAG: hypothetical protein Q7R76_01270 [Candidatus Woesearchaeota archaeon]|nr:hypothetical protein [Candidatus Woesearchaeota archaeon]
MKQTHTTTKLSVLIVSFLFLLSIIIVVHADSIDVFCQHSVSGVENCIKEIAIQRHDIKICDRIVSDSMRGSCIGSFAKTLDDIELCKKIPKDARGADARNRCFLKFVKTAEDQYICTDFIKDEKYKDDCFSAILDKKRNDTTLCANFVSPGKRVGCYMKVAKNLHNPELCTLIRDEGKTERTSQCRFCEQKGINYQEEYQNCQKYFFMDSITNLCDAHEKQIEVKMAKGEKQELTFSGENQIRDRFWITFNWAVLDGEYTAYAATIKFSDGVRNDAFESLHFGDSAKAAQNDVAVQLLDLWNEAETSDSGGTVSETTYATLCVFRPSTRTKEEPSTSSSSSRTTGTLSADEQARRKADLLKELEEKRKRKQQARESNHTSDGNETTSSDGDAENTQKSASGTENASKSAQPQQQNSRIKVRNGGFFYRFVGFFKNLFS